MNVVTLLHSGNDTAGPFTDFFAQKGVHSRTLIAPDASPQDFLMAAHADLLIVMGGAMGVYEQKQFPFLSREIEILKDRIRANSPTLGICLGSQLLAAAAGANVYRSKQEEFGWSMMKVTEAGLSDKNVGAIEALWRKPVFHWHQDVFDLPKSAERLLFSEHCSNQAFKLSDRIYGFQFHIELDARELPDWIKSEPGLEYGKNPGIQSKEQIIANGALHGDDLKKTAHELLSRLCLSFE
jgi:GMP synthase (glutamine-hydrolysing)